MEKLEETRTANERTFLLNVDGTSIRVSFDRYVDDATAARLLRDVAMRIDGARA